MIKQLIWHFRLWRCHPKARGDLARFIDNVKDCSELGLIPKPGYWPRSTSDKLALDVISESAGLKSLLWDMDLMPEQLERGTDQWNQMKLLAVAWDGGRTEGKNTADGK